jgi:2-amino-4-hydroxy-6-hydroxymethyldihydropteridine diphosphokinase
VSDRHRAVTAVFGLGANLGDPPAQLTRAVRALAERVDALVVSSVYRSAPSGYAGQPDFYNLVCTGRTGMAPGELLAIALAIEAAAGRVRTFRNAARTLDVDLLDAGGAVVDSPRLMLPHPRMAVRGFVLVPLAEVAPWWRHPVLGRTAAELMARAPADPSLRRVGPPPVVKETNHSRVL